MLIQVKKSKIRQYIRLVYRSILICKSKIIINCSLAGINSWLQSNCIFVWVVRILWFKPLLLNTNQRCPGSVSSQQRRVVQSLYIQYCVFIGSQAAPHRKIASLLLWCCGALLSSRANQRQCGRTLRYLKKINTSFWLQLHTIHLPLSALEKTRGT